MVIFRRPQAQPKQPVKLAKPKIRETMFTFGVPELLVILVIVLILFGGKRLPQIGRALGKSIREFKSVTGDKKEDVSTWTKDDKQHDGSKQNKESVQTKREEIPGIKEAEEIKETVRKVKAASKFFLKK
jgi:sec-independent protein translocase protein TatA